jgi:hypothetical protein
VRIEEMKRVISSFSFRKVAAFLFRNPVQKRLRRGFSSTDYSGIFLPSSLMSLALAEKILSVSV